MSRRFSWTLTLLVFGLFATTAFADTPSTAYIFPAGGQRGTTVEFRVGAHFLHGGSPFEMLGPGVKASKRIRETDTIWFEGPLIVKPASQASESYPKDHLGSVEIASDAAPGMRHWRLWTSQGAVGVRKFVVGDLPEIVEKEIDGRPIPVQVTLPVTINGRMFPREDVDIWTFDAVGGQQVVCEVVASRLGSPLDSRLEVLGPDGRRVADNVDHYGSDSYLRFTAPTTGKYQVRINDVSYRGLQDYVYRLTITSGAHLERVYPLGGRRGESVAFDVFGQAVPEQPQHLVLPDTDEPVLQSFLLNDTMSNPILLDVGDHPEVVEKLTDENDQPDADNAHTAPITLNGRIEKPGDADVWAFRAKKGEPLEFQLMASRFGSPLDPVLVITDEQGKQLARVACTPTSRIEPISKFTPPADGVYFVSVTDFREKRGGLEFAYRLKITPPKQPDFQLSFPSDSLTLYRGSQAKAKITVDRRGFGGEIKLRAVDLPAGVEAAEVKIAANKKNADFVFKAAKDAKVQAARIKIIGEAMDGERSLKRMATKITGAGEKRLEHVLLAVSMPTPFTVDGVAFRTGYAARGTVFRRKFALHRNGYEGPIRVALADRQIRHRQGVTGPSFDLPDGATEFEYPIRLPTWLEMNRTGRIVVMAVGEIEDEQGVKHTVSFSSGTPKDQIIILTAPSPMSVRVSRRSLRASAGTTAEFNVSVGRGVLKPAHVEIELLVPAHVQGVDADPLTIPADAKDGNLKLHFKRPLGPFNTPLVVRATMMSDGDAVIAETKIELVE